MPEPLRCALVLLAAVGAHLASASASSADLVRAKDIPFNNAIRDVAAADFNGDGDKDLAVSAKRSVTMLEGRGDGTFKRGRRFALGQDPQVLAVADLDRDRDKDIVSANLTSDNISVLIGRGNGTFKPRRNYRVGDGPTYVDVGRLNDDRKPDLAVTNIDGNDVSVLLGRGDGTFRRKRDYRVDGTPRSVAIARLNGDRERDLAVALFDRIALLRGKGDGRFKRGREIELGFGLWELIAPDINGDGLADPTVTNLSNFGVYVLRNTGNGAFGDRAVYGFVGLPAKVAVADMTGGRQKDLVVEAEEYPLDFEDDPGRFYVLRGDRDGSFSDDIDVELDGDGGRFAIADLDADGTRDVAAITYAPAPKIEVFLNRRRIGRPASGVRS